MMLVDGETAGKLAFGSFLLMMIVAAAGDVMTRRIPNRLIVIMLVLFVPFASAAGFPGWMFIGHATTAIVLLLLGYVLFSFGILGAGDAKLMAAAGLWLGSAPSILFALFTALAGGVLAAAIGLLFLLHLEIGTRSHGADGALRTLKPDVPYGFALAVGAILAVPYSWLSIASLGH